MNEVALAQVFHRGLQFSSVDIIPPMLHVRLLLDASIRSKKEESLGPPQTIGFLEIGERCVQSIFTSHILYRFK